MSSTLLVESIKFGPPRDDMLTPRPPNHTAEEIRLAERNVRRRLEEAEDRQAVSGGGGLRLASGEVFVNGIRGRWTSIEEADVGEVRSISRREERTKFARADTPDAAAAAAGLLLARVRPRPRRRRQTGDDDDSIDSGAGATQDSVTTDDGGFLFGFLDSICGIQAASK